jgi:hypothetical protein
MYCSKYKGNIKIYKVYYLKIFKDSPSDADLMELELIAASIDFSSILYTQKKIISKKINNLDRI